MPGLDLEYDGVAEYSFSLNCDFTFLQNSIPRGSTVAGLTDAVIDWEGRLVSIFGHAWDILDAIFVDVAEGTTRHEDDDALNGDFETSTGEEKQRRWR